MTLEQQRRAKVRQHLEAAVRLQRQSWDETLAIEDLTHSRLHDLYALVTELAGGLEDDEPIPEAVLRTLISQHSGIETQKETIQ